MSLVDPGTRWWNKYAVRRVGAWTCWVLAIGSAFVGTWSIWAESAAPLPEWFGIAGSIAPIPLILLGEFLYFMGSSEKEFDLRVVLMPVGAYFVAIGFGWVLGQYQARMLLSLTGIIFTIGGVLALVLVEILIRRYRSNEKLRSWVERNGTITSGQVTRARTYSSNYTTMTRVTVKFVDSQGRDRWASQSVPGEFSTNSRLRVRYSQADLGRKAAVLITRR